MVVKKERLGEKHFEKHLSSPKLRQKHLLTKCSTIWETHFAIVMFEKRVFGVPLLIIFAHHFLFMGLYGQTTDIPYGQNIRDFLL